jgi:hypothetical protein
LGLTPNPNNGTLRLPLKPVGLHSPETAVEEPEDPANASTSTNEPGTDAISISPIEASSAADPNVVPPQMVGVDPPATSEVTKIDSTDKPVPTETIASTEKPASTETSTNDGEKSDEDDEEEAYESYLSNLLGKLNGFKDWLGHLLGGGNPKDSDSTGEK